MRFMARPKAPTYPDADHSAPTMPVTRVNPDDWLCVSWVTTPCKVSAALGATSRIICISGSVALLILADQSQ
jgi:hypothetical protein